MSIFKKIGKAVGKAAKAVGKGVGNAAKFTVKNPLKVLAPIAGAAGILATGGAIAPALAGKLAASKIGSTVFGKMVTKTMNTGTIVREKIASTLKKSGKKATKNEVDTVEQGLQAEIVKRKGHKLPVDRKSKSGTEARAKLKKLSNDLTDNQLSFEQQNIIDTMNAERQVLIDNPNTNGIISRNELDDNTLMAMKNAGSVQQNLLGSGVELLGNLLGTSAATQKKIADVASIITGQNSDPYLKEDLDSGVEAIETKLNEGSIGGSLMNIIKMPIVWIIGSAVIIYFIVNKNSKPKKRR